MNYVDQWGLSSKDLYSNSTSDLSYAEQNVCSYGTSVGNAMVEWWMAMCKNAWNKATTRIINWAIIWAGYWAAWWTVCTPIWPWLIVCETVWVVWGWAIGWAVWGWVSLVECWAWLAQSLGWELVNFVDYATCKVKNTINSSKSGKNNYHFEDNHWNSVASNQDKIVGKNELLKIAKNNWFESFEQLKKYFWVDSRRDAFRTKAWELYFKAKNLKWSYFDPIFTNIFK